jgi:hypothetical protein
MTFKWVNPLHPTVIEPKVIYFYQHIKQFWKLTRGRDKSGEVKGS